MRKIIVISMITLDGVMQAPGAPGEDTSGNFKFGGWVAPFSDAGPNEVMQNLLQPADLLLGRTTFQIWEDYWPRHASAWPGINEVKKFVFSKTRQHSDWNGSVFINSVEDIRKLKETDGTDIKVRGSSKLVQTMLEHDIVDELWLLIHPIVLGSGKRLFADGSIPTAYHLAECTTTLKGVIMAHYIRSGSVKTGTVGG